MYSKILLKKIEQKIDAISFVDNTSPTRNELIHIFKKSLSRNRKNRFKNNAETKRVHEEDCN